jgi:hypothetical protein
MTNVDMSIDAVATQRLIAHLMSASVPVEEHLRQGKPLTTQQFESLSLTIEGLRTFMGIWKRKHNISRSAITWPLEPP